MAFLVPKLAVSSSGSKLVTILDHIVDQDLSMISGDLNCVLIFFPLRFDEQKLRSLLKRFDLSLHKTIKTTANNFRKIFEVETFSVFKL